MWKGHSLIAKTPSHWFGNLPKANTPTNSANEYHNFLFPAEDLTFLGAKTTCKDRWRQVLNEANRIETKYLFTLQPSISANQLNEMKHEHVVLVIPEVNRNSFDVRYKNDLLSLKQFVEKVREKQYRHYPR